MKFHSCCVYMLALLLTSCSTRDNVSTETPEAMTDSINMRTSSIFGVNVHIDERTAIRELSVEGLLKLDTINEKDGKFESAIIEFAGVKFGLNKGFLFLTSRHDKQAIDSLVNRISKFYGEPCIDDNGEPEWSCYHWNLCDTIPDRPYIRIRPVYSDEGGIMMTWRFND